MIDRRSFLIGSGAILMASFVSKGSWPLTERQSVVLLIEDSKSLEKLYFVPQSCGLYEVRMGTPDLCYESFR